MVSVDLYGSSSFCIPTAQQLLNVGYPLRCVTTRLPSGHRSRVDVPSPLAEFARAHHLPLSEVRTKKELENVYTHWPAHDAIVVASFGIFISSSLLRLPRLGVLNIHPSMLPKYRGPSPVQTAILNGDTMTGVSIILLDEEMDHGPILLQATTEILPLDTTATLKERLSRLGAALLVDAIKQWDDHTITPKPQDDRRATLTKKISKEDGRVIWTQSAQTIERKSRAFDPWPGCWSYWRLNNKQVIVKLFEPVIGGQSSCSPVGTVLGLKKGLLLIQCGGGSTTGFRSIQREGKHRMDVAAFIQGNRSILSAILQ